MVIGGLTNSDVLGGWTLKLRKADRLPQDVASAFYALYGGKKVGESYVPEYYVGIQVVNV